MSGIRNVPLDKAHSDKPLVSIITPVLNGEKYIADNIKSILSQTYPNIEHIVIDGNSADKTVSLVKELNPKAIVISEPDRGATDAINKGLRNASGEIIAILSQDDYYAHGNVIQRIVDLFMSDPHLKVIYGKVRCIHPRTEQTLVVYGEPFNLKKMNKGNIQMMPCPATFARKEVYDTVGFFSLNYVICTDYEYYLRVTKLYTPYFLNDIFTIMRWGGFSTKNIYGGHIEVYKLLINNGINRVTVLKDLIHRYIMTFFSLSFQKIGLNSLVRFYRRMKGQL